MADNQNIINIKKYNKKRHLNVGIILFGVVFAYLLLTTILFFSTERTAVYEVREGSILKDTSYTGIALREEEICYADESGYVNYFYESGKKVPLGHPVYVLSPEAILEEESQDANEEVVLKSENWNRLLLKVQAFNENFRKEDFYQADFLKKEVDSILTSNTTQNRFNQLHELLGQEESGFHSYPSADDGIIAYSVDGYEDLQPEDVTEKELSKTGYTKVTLNNNHQIQAGDPVYRFITSEKWSIVIKLTPEIEKQFLEQMGDRESMYIRLRMVKDNTTIGGFLMIQYDTENQPYGCISLSDSMIRYVEDRYLDVEIILENEFGLKVPKSSVIGKDFFVVPEAYLTSGGYSKSSGVLRKNPKNSKVEYVEVTVFDKDVENGVVYLKMEGLQKGDLLVMPESEETITLSDTISLNGVYNVNKGYAVFTPIHILSESTDYYIIQSGDSYGLSNYDHIALYGDSVQDNQIISQ